MARLERSDGLTDELDGDHLTIGRSADNDVVVADGRTASRLHARLDHLHGVWVLCDAGSRNGTHLNGIRLTDPATLHPGDQIRVGSSTFTFRDDPNPLATVADQEPEVSAEALSHREREIVALVAKGLTDQQIANTLFISVATIRSHLDRIRDKTGRRRRPELTRLAVELRLV